MTAPLQYGTPPTEDPTAVMGRRTLAWIADLLLYSAVVAGGFASMAEYVDIPAGIAAEDACDVLESQTGELEGGCFAWEDRVYLLDTGETGVQTALSFGWFVFFVVLQGFTGGSPGKLLFGLRVVDQHGTRAGIAKSLGRTLMWIVDAAPWLVPLVGPITAFTSTGHRRVGDLAAGTYVVASSSVGRPVVPGAAGQAPWGAPPPAGPGWMAPSAPPTGWPTSPPPASPPPVPTTTDPGWAPPAAPEPTSGSSQAESDPEPGPAAEPAPFAAPGSEAAPATATSSPEPATQASPATQDWPAPQWDQARNTYLQWDPNRQAWLQWDAARQHWKPIDT